MNRDVAALLVIGLAVVLWAFAVPSYPRTFDGFGSTSRADRVDGGEVGHEYQYHAVGYGMAGGPVRFGVLSIEAWEQDASGVKRVAAPSPQLVQEMQRRLGERPIGWHLDLEASLFAAVLSLVLTGVTFGWWLIVRRPVSPGSAWLGWRSARVLGLAAWPAIVGTGTALGVWRRLGRPETSALIAGPEVSIAGTLLLLSAGLVVLLTRRAAPGTGQAGASRPPGGPGSRGPRGAPPR